MKKKKVKLLKITEPSIKDLQDELKLKSKILSILEHDNIIEIEFDVEDYPEPTEKEIETIKETYKRGLIKRIL